MLKSHGAGRFGKIHLVFPPMKKELSQLAAFACFGVIAMASANPPPARMVIDLRDAAQIAPWSSVDDRVMGGVSASQIAASAEGLIFSGTVSLEQNGGFASIRAKPREYDLAGATALVVRVRGDGKRYKLTVRTDATFDGVQYQARFTPPADAWGEVSLPLADFQPTYRGRRVEDAPPLDPARIVGFGFLIADRQAGPFQLTIAAIQATF
jgi:NADH dehydrogenase [ubiquinone] 1 alpha subcomplex assembly factor 1